MKIAIITGVSSCIGQELAKRLHAMGWKVYGLSRRDPDIQNDAFVWIECDLAQADAIYESLQSVSEPGVDLLVSNAGVAKLTECGPFLIVLKTAPGMRSATSRVQASGATVSYSPRITRAGHLILPKSTRMSCLTISLTVS